WALHRGDTDGSQQRRIWRMVCDHRLRLSDRQRLLCALRTAPFAGKTDLVRARAAIGRQPAQSRLERHRHQPDAVVAVFGTQMIVMVANAFGMPDSAAGAISVRPDAAGTASGAMGFLQQGIGSLVSQMGAWLGGHFATTLPLTAFIVMLSLACTASMIFLVPR